MIAKAQRLNQVQEYYFSRKLEEIRALEAAGRQVLNLGIGSPDLPPAEGVVEALVDSARQPENHAYQPYRSTRELRLAIREFYRQTYGVAPDADREILPLLGSKEGVMYISLAFLNPGDVVLVPDPGYPAYAAVARLLGARVQTYSLTEAGGWYPDWESLAARDWSQVKLMWINYPHMPTGTAADKAVFERLAALARQHNFLLVNDNPYSQVLNDEPLSLLAADPELTHVLELNSLSKSFNMAGWRVGMVLGHARYIDAVLQAKSNVDSGMFLPIQHAAARALHLSDSWHEWRNGVYRSRRLRAATLLQELGCRLQPGQVGMFLWARVPEGVADGYAWVDELLHGAGVFITPGGIFGENGQAYVRLSLCAPEEVFEQALKRIKQWRKKKKLQSA